MAYASDSDSDSDSYEIDHYRNDCDTDSDADSGMHSAWNSNIEVKTSIDSLKAVYGEKPLCLSWRFTMRMFKVMFKGDRQTMKFIHHKTPGVWHPETTYYAARGHLSCLMYAHKHGAPWHTDTTLSAAGGGHLDCLVFACENGANLHKDTMITAICARDLACFKYAKERMLSKPGYHDMIRECMVNIVKSPGCVASHNILSDIKATCNLF